MVYSRSVCCVRALVIGRRLDDASEKLALAVMVVLPVIGVIAGLVPQSRELLPLELPELATMMMGNTGVEQQTLASQSSLNLFNWMPLGIFGLYLVGLALSGLQLLRGVLRLLRIDIGSTQTRLPGVYATPEPVSALASPTGKIILADALFTHLTDEERNLVIQHEAAHIRRRDPQWFLMLSILDCVFWFNPFIRRQTTRCRLAAEMSADRLALEARPEMRSLYARSLVSALKHTAGNALHCVPAAFSKPSKGDYRMRMAEIMKPSEKMGKSARTWLISGLSICLLPVGMLQIAMAETQSLASDFEMTFWPIEGKLTSKFGQRTHPITKQPAFHSGIDFAAAKGTPVKAPVGGVVTRAEFSESYGNLVDLDHGNGMTSRYSQLDTITVTVGDKISSGSEVGTVGASGRYATGPHLHFEVLENGEQKDPADYFKG